MLDVLAQFEQEANILEMSEAQAYVVLPYFLSGMGDDQNNSVRGSSRACKEVVTCWLEAVHYRLWSYAKGTAISQFIMAVRNRNKKPGDKEMSCSNRLNTAFHRYENRLTAFKRFSMLVDGLDSGIMSLVSRDREETRNATYLELVYYAQAKGDTRRVRCRKRWSPKYLFLENESALESLPNP